MSEVVQCVNGCGPVSLGSRCQLCDYMPNADPASVAGPIPRVEAELRPLFGEGRYSLFPGCTVGRGTDVDLSPVAESQYISRRHATLRFEGEQWWLEALESANETRVNGVLVAPGSQTALAGGDTVNLGGVAFVFRPRL